MGTFRAYLKKENIESMRQYKYLIIGVGILLFAILDPIMLKALPAMLKGKTSQDLSALFQVNSLIAHQNYIKDLFQIGIIFVVLNLCGTLGDEIGSSKLVFPFSKGNSSTSMVAAKFVHYALTVVIFISLGFCLNHYYAGILFTADKVEVSTVAAAAFQMVVYFLFTLALTIFLSSLFRRGIPAGVLTLVICYASASLSGIKQLVEFLPYNLITYSGNFNGNIAWKSVLFSLGYSILLIAAAMYRMRKVEVV